MATENSTDPRVEETQTAYIMLLVGGLVGGTLVLASLISSYYWWGPFLTWLRDGDRDQLWQPILGVLGLMAGMAIIFVAFLAAKQFERVDATLRRVLYGFNAFLACFLTLLLLVVVNVFVQIRYPLPFDTTAGGFYSLDERTKKWVTALEQPVEIHMLMDPQRDRAYADMKNLLAQMQSSNPRYVSVEEVELEGYNEARFLDLSKRFPGLSLRQGGGVLVASGANPEKNFTLIGAGELTNLRGSGESQQRSFNGETRLMQELLFLAEDKRRPVVYLLQGPAFPEITDRGPEGLSSLIERLTQANYEVKPLAMTGPDPEKFNVPPDAEVVLIVGPKRTIAPMVDGLNRYMNPTDPALKKGRIVALLGPTAADSARAGQMFPTGLENFFGQFGVEVTASQVMMLRNFDGEVIARGNRPYPEAVSVRALRVATEGRHPVAQIAKETQTWIDVRQLGAKAAQAPGAKFSADPLIATAGFVWLETDLKVSSFETWNRVGRDPKVQEERLKREPLPVLLSVSESSSDADPHAFSKPNQGKTPRMMVFGCSSFATNAEMPPRGGAIEFDMIRGSIDWCRERYGSIGVEPKSYQYFSLPKTTSMWNLFYLPLAAMTLGVFGLGVIVWNVRRT